jgi:hypothetical protein
LDVARRQQSDCAQRPQKADGAATAPTDRMIREEARLKQRLADLQAQRPVLKALYAALTPAQRAMLEPRRARLGQRMRARSQMRRGPGAQGLARPAPAPQ